MQRITPYLWFDNQAEQAAQYYTSVFKDSRIIDTTRYGAAGPGPEGSVMTVTFQLEGQDFVALNGGPQFRFTEAVSFFVSCESQPEVDELWERLSAGGEQGPCGWLKDRFGLSWQIIPRVLLELMNDPDPVKAGRVTEAMLTMGKIDIAGLQAAYARA
jgi:predicted 3-demethylubiquinone-9 3-methyltransferase (glyoxalase superfamily)